MDPHRLAKLCHASTTKSFLPEKDVAWGTPIDVVGYALPDSMLSLAGSPELEAMDPERRRELAREVVSLIEREAAAAQVEVALEADSATPKVLGHRASLHQLLLSLTLNAIEVTPAGESVVLRVAPDADEPRESVWIEVVDAGPGMEPDELQRVFEPERSADTAAASLSLIVAHQIVREHGGAIGVRSAVGRGSRFEVRLPAEPSA